MHPIILPDTIHSRAKWIETEDTEDRVTGRTVPGVQSEIPEFPVGKTLQVTWPRFFHR